MVTSFKVYLHYVKAEINDLTSSELVFACTQFEYITQCHNIQMLDVRLSFLLIIITHTPNFKISHVLPLGCLQSTKECGINSFVTKE